MNAKRDLLDQFHLVCRLLRTTTRFLFFRLSCSMLVEAYILFAIAASRVARIVSWLTDSIQSPTVKYRAAGANDE